MRKGLYPIPDESRPAWFFLELKTPNQDGNNRINGWELLIGNRHRIVENIDRLNRSESEEIELLSELMDQLSNHYIPTAELYTNNEETIALLKTRLILSDFSEPSLRGLCHVSFREILHSFDPYHTELIRELEINSDNESDQRTSKTEMDLSLSVEQMWKLRSRLASAIPPDELAGKEL